MATNSTSEAARWGSAIYSPLVLAGYDWFVLGFSNRLVWRCPSRRILAFYNTQVGARHLDIGVGTGYFLDACCFPGGHPARLVLADLNPNALGVTARRVRRYDPEMAVANVLEPLPFAPSTFESVGMNYLLHCLPGTLWEKAVAFQYVRPLLAPGGRVFGTMILGSGVPHNWIGRRLLRAYNARGIFSNIADTAADLATILRAQFPRSAVHVVNCVAFFVGQV